jgi:sialic acid synthase
MAVKIIAEIGCNHKGDIKIAQDLIKAAKRCGADVAKFQKRNNKLLLNKKEYESPHPEPWNSYGNTYGLHREALEFNIDQHKELQDFCSTIGIEYTSSVWELDSAKEISELNPLFIKVPSATNLDFKMQKFLCENYNGKIHVSVGMTKKTEIAQVIKFYTKKGRIDDLVLYCCTSGYPVSEKDICLLEIKNLQKLMENTEGGVGFSGHHLGIAPDIAAVTLGVDWIERHFTLDRTWKGTDHAASLEPEGLRRLCRDIKNVEKALSYKEEDILTIEKVQRAKLKKCIFE